MLKRSGHTLRVHGTIHDFVRLGTGQDGAAGADGLLRPRQSRGRHPSHAQRVDGAMSESRTRTLAETTYSPVLCERGRHSLRWPPIRVRRPVRPHICADQPTSCADHSRAQRAHRHIVRQPVGIHDHAVVAPYRLAVDEKIAAAVRADVSERDGPECFVSARCHPLSRWPAALRWSPCR